MNSKILLITGESGSGKSTLCQQLVMALKARDVDVAGLLSLPLVENDIKTGIVMENVRTGERRMLAGRAKTGEGLAHLRWRFDPAALASGVEILQSAVPCEVLVVDELGPLELVRGEGWINALGILVQGQFRVALVVVRPSLESEFRLQCEPMPIKAFVATRPEQTALYERILTEIGP